jgi:signal transduction histidine kinase/CheY-like chemotaxis protein
MSVDRLGEHAVLRYVVGVAAAGATIATLIPLRFLIEPLPSPPFLLTVMIVAWVAGLGPAIVAVVISAVALDYWFVPPFGAIATTWHELASVVSFAAVGIGVAWLTATRRQAEDDRKALLARERASRASAEAANRAKDEFVAMLGHEVRNPLSAIVNAVHVLDRAGAHEETTRHAREVIARQATSITRIVEDLLEINRIATGKIRLDPQPVDLAESVRRCLATLAGRTSGHRVALDADDVWVHGDPVRLEQIVVNLLDNAVKYTPAGGAIQIRVSREGGHAVLRVRDTGIGIARDVLPRIFELFVQGEPAAIRGRRGLGIGLAVVQRLAELHGGTIDAASDGPGRGSTFTLRLRSIAAPAGRTPRDRPAMTPAPRRRIVVAETDADLRAILRALLEVSGHDVSEATDGPEAFAAALRVRPDVMLVDVDLAGFDGYELARRLRMTPEAKSTLLIALTGDGRADDVERARAAGFDHHATKPLEPDALAEILRR